MSEFGRETVGSSSTSKSYLLGTHRNVSLSLFLLIVSCDVLQIAMSSSQSTEPSGQAAADEGCVDCAPAPTSTSTSAPPTETESKAEAEAKQDLLDPSTFIPPLSLSLGSALPTPLLIIEVSIPFLSLPHCFSFCPC